jgi:ribose/xylose/arabinose/galactoside ABC-type transport system permease subunit
MSSGIENSPIAAIDATRGEDPRAPEAPVTFLNQVALFLQRGGVAAVTVLLVLIVISSLIWPSFHTLDNLRLVVLGEAFLGIVAIGMTLVIITGGIDLSVGSVFALGGVVGVYYAGHGGTVLAIVMTIVVCGAVGLLNGVLVGYGGMAPFIVTLATLFGVRGLVIQITNAGATVYSVKSGSTFAKLGTGHWLTFGLPVIFAVAFYVIFHFVLERTPYGLRVFSIGSSEPAALLMGLKVRRTKVSLYVLSAVLAGIAGMLQGALAISADPTIGLGLELQAISAVVIGGTLLTGGAGSLIGTGAGVLLLGAISSVLLELQLDTTWNNVVSGAFLVVVVVLQRLLVRARTK